MGKAKTDNAPDGFGVKDFTLRELADFQGASRNTARKRLAQMMAHGVAVQVVSEKPSRPKRYRVTSDAVWFFLNPYDITMAIVFARFGGDVFTCDDITSVPGAGKPWLRTMVKERNIIRSGRNEIGEKLFKVNKTK